MEVLLRDKTNVVCFGQVDSDVLMEDSMDAPPSVGSGDIPHSVISTPLATKKVIIMKQEIDFYLFVFIGQFSPLLFIFCCIFFFFK